jgi:hypothetical protein
LDITRLGETTKPLPSSTFWQLVATPRIFSTLGRVAATTGSLAGFLFGLPRSSRSEATAAAVTTDASGQPVMTGPVYPPNTNLEDISDWLTKILVGLGLTQLGSIPTQFKSLMDTVKVVIGSTDDASAIAGSVIVGYVILGFLATYLWARTRLSQALRLADATATLDRVEQKIDNLATSMGKP